MFLEVQRRPFLLVQPQGGKLWRLKYRFGGKEKLLSLGNYNEVSLKDARRKRDKAREQLRDGRDPSELRKKTKAIQAIAATNSYEAVARAWHLRWSAGKNAKHASGVLSRLERDVFPAVGTMPFESVTAAHLVACALKIEATGAPEYATRVLQTASQIGRYAVAHDHQLRAFGDRGDGELAVLGCSELRTNSKSSGAFSMRAASSATGTPPRGSASTTGQHRASEPAAGIAAVGEELAHSRSHSLIAWRHQSPSRRS